MPFRMARFAAQTPDTQLAMPVEGASVRKVANTWHAPRDGMRVHEGQDIFAPRGTPVYSATAGIVTRLGTGGLGGISVYVLGPGARTYYYAHLGNWATGLEIGDPVDRHTLLGHVDNTGNARGTPPHLHFGVYSRQGAIDPLPLLVDRIDVKGVTTAHVHGND
jgi:murein DD-endopeptidase MepM/ murein hydrolase activator NlpD